MSDVDRRKRQEQGFGEGETSMDTMAVTAGRGQQAQLAFERKHCKKC